MTAQATGLCKACGLCCTGHLFIWAKLRPSELDPAAKLGMKVFRSDPRQRGFSQPCPLWQGQCTIYASPHYPHVCRAYKCKVLKELLGGQVSFPQALAVIGRTWDMIRALEPLLPITTNPNFRERFVAQIESGRGSTDQDFFIKADALLCAYAEDFGVLDLIEQA